MQSLIFVDDKQKLQQLQSHEDAIVVEKSIAKYIECFKENTFSDIMIATDNLSEFDQKIIFNLYSISKPGAKINLHIGTSGESEKASLFQRFIIAGFLLDNNVNESFYTYKKPEWSGKVVAFKSKGNAKGQIPVTPSETKTLENIINKPSTNGMMGVYDYQEILVKVDPQNPFKTVKLGDGGLLIDEDKLLSNEAGYDKLAKEENCSTKPKACKNCSCGRKELE